MEYKIAGNIGITREDKLLLLIARTKINNEIKSEIISILKQGIDWNYIIDRCDKHKLTALLYWNLKYIGYNSTPSEIMEYLKSIFEENARQNLLLTGELINILNKFNSNKINAIHYKGPSLAQLAYNNLVFRQFIDIDILVKRSDIIKVNYLMNQMGYVLESCPENIDESMYFKTQTEHKYINYSSGNIIEIHNKVQGHFFHFPTDPYFLYEDLRLMNFNKHGFKTFNYENLLILLCIHGARHNWSRISWICDINELIHNNGIDWSKVIENSEKLGVKRILLINLLLTRYLFELELPDIIQICFEKDKVPDVICHSVMEKIFNKENSSYKLFERLSLDLRKRESLKNSIIDILRSIFNPTYEDYREFKLPTYLYSVYYLIRPVLLLKRYKSI